jgi:acyl-ACP thioesterase
VTFAAVNYHREIPMGDTVELLYAPSEEGWYVQGRHDGRTSFECYLEIGS